MAVNIPFGEIIVTGSVAEIGGQYYNQDSLWIKLDVERQGGVQIQVTGSEVIAYLQETLRVGDSLRLKAAVCGSDNPNIGFRLVISDKKAILTHTQRELALRKNYIPAFIILGKVTQVDDDIKTLLVRDFNNEEYYLHYGGTAVAYINHNFQRGDTVQLRVSVITRVPACCDCTLKILDKDDILEHRREITDNIDLLKENAND